MGQKKLAKRSKVKPFIKVRALSLQSCWSYRTLSIKGCELFASVSDTICIGARGSQRYGSSRYVQGAIAAGGFEEGGQEVVGGAVLGWEEQVVLHASPGMDHLVVCFLLATSDQLGSQF